jgi:hypothetical protein
MHHREDFSRRERGERRERSGNNISNLFYLCGSAIVQSRAFPGRILTTDGHGWTRMGQRLLIRAHPCLSVVEFLGLRLAALCSLVAV